MPGQPRKKKNRGVIRKHKELEKVCSLVMSLFFNLSHLSSCASPFSPVFTLPHFPVAVSPLSPLPILYRFPCIVHPVHHFPSFLLSSSNILIPLTLLFGLSFYSPALPCLLPQSFFPYLVLLFSLLLTSHLFHILLTSPSVPSLLLRHWFT